MFELQERLEKFLFDSPTGTGWLTPLLRYPYALIRDFLKGELNLRAMSLVYTTLLSVVPLLAFSFSIFKGLGIHRDLEPLVAEFFRPLGENSEDMTAKVMGFVENISSGVLGSLGLAFLLFTVVSTIQKIEASLNFVWRVERPRSLARRVSEYLSLMIIGPVFIVAAVSLTASVLDTAIIERITNIRGIDSAVVMVGRLVPYLIVSLLFAFLYIFIPNTRVRVIPALIGGLAAGVLWAIVGAVFTAFIAYSSRLELVYTSFAVLIVALIWIYIAWVILLFGSQLSFYVQHPECMRRGQQEVRLTASLAERLAFNVMFLIAKRFKDGEQGWTINALATQLSVPSALLGTVMRSLEGAGLLVATEDERFVPGRDISEIDLNQIVGAARKHHRGEPTVHVHGVPEADELEAEINAALQHRLEKQTLRELIDGAN